VILRETIRRILLEDLASQLQQLKDKYVGDGKPMTEKDFEKILEVAANKFYIIAWLAKRVGTGMIKAEDIYKYKEYFDIFEKNKKKFTHKDINLYKTAEDLQKFLDEVFNVREGDLTFTEIQGKDNFVSKNDIEKLENTGGIKYLGIYDNGNFQYQVFQIFRVGKEVWKQYRDILGRCKGRNRGAKIDICTIGQYHYFREYLTDPRGSSYFLLFNLDDSRSPYQLHYESGQFMDKNDRERHNIKQLKFFEWVGDMVPKYSIENPKFPGNFEIPVKGKGTLDDRGRKQGLWKEFDRGRLDAIRTYVNSVVRGPYVEYFDEKKIQEKGFIGPNDRLDGEFESYHPNEEVHKKGKYKLGERVGVWIMGDEDGVYRMIDYDNNPIEVTGFTSTGKVRYVSTARRQDNERWRPNPAYGKTIFFNPSGSVNAIGTLGVDNSQLGEWTYYFADGSIKSQGKFLRGMREGEWTDVLKGKDGKKYIFVANFRRNIPNEKIKIYDEKGNFLKKKNAFDLKSRYWNDMSPDLESFRLY